MLSSDIIHKHLLLFIFKMETKKPLSEKIVGTKAFGEFFPSKDVSSAVKRLKELKGIEKHKTIINEINEIFGSFE